MLRGGDPHDLASQQGIPVGITVDANDVYWVTQSGKGALWKVAKAGGQATALLDGNAQPGLDNYEPTWQPVSVLADGGDLYWTTIALGTGGLWTMPSAGGMPAKLADTGINATDFPQGLFVLSGVAHWGGYQAPNVYDARVFSLDGAMFAQQDVSSLGSYAQGVAADADHVYFTTSQAGSPGGVVARIPLAGGGPENLADASDTPSGLALDDTHVYFADVDYKSSSTTGAIRRIAKSGGAIETLVTGAFGGYAVAVDDTNVYFTDFTPSCGAVRSVPKVGGSATVLASGQDMPLGIALDDGFVYWTNRSFNDGGSVMKIAK